MQLNSIQKQSRILIVVLAWLGMLGCKESPDTLLVLRTADETGLNFSNTIPESDSLNIFIYDYIYNGGGVAVADFNNDGLQDIFFTGNVMPNRLYLNTGALKFKDVTEEANVNIYGRWNSGVTVVDINNDGWSDLYVCATKSEDSVKRANMLFLNKGLNENDVPVFEEVASQYGIADVGFSHMASFFDYDLDGDLDLYVLTNKQAGTLSSNYRAKIINGTAQTNDRLYRNNGDGSFTNVTKEAGIVYEGFGLGLAISDINLDGWPDIYVSNDFITNDLLYINNRNGTFSNQIAQSIFHQSLYSMGSDVADFNNDGLADIVTMDMLPESNERKKTSINNKNYLTYIHNEQYGYEYQHMRNMLQLNNGIENGVGFSEIGQLAGIFQTEWSWSAQFVDFDNNGFKDLFITNGFPKDITDRDFVAYREDVKAYASFMQLLDSVPVVRIPNYVYRNNGDLTFTDASKDWGVVQPSFSNGAAYADFDNDGDLDYVINNINEEAHFYENTLYAKDKPVEEHFLRIKLQGTSQNRMAVGTKATVYTNGMKQFVELELARGYISSVENILHFGMGTYTVADSVIIQWPDGKVQRLLDVKADQVVTIRYTEADLSVPTPTPSKGSLFADRTQSVKLDFNHQEEDRIDFNIQRTLPHKFSQSGPGMSVGDINQDNLDDLVIGGASGNAITYFLQQKDGTFDAAREIPGTKSKLHEDEGLLLFDADADGDLDLYAVSGSMEFQPPSKYYQDRFYRNTGKGNYVLDSLALPKIESSGSCVRAADFDDDGDLDLFVGGRVVPGSYPFAPRSYILRNNNGTFTDVTAEVCPDVATIGMVTDAIFSDFNNDGASDLIIVGEFMPVTFFTNVKGTFKKLQDTGLENFTGWWNSIVSGDFDRDGDSDFVVGNLGLNNAFQITANHPLKVFAKDFDKNQSVDAILACYIERTLTDREKDLYPIHFWDEINSQSPRFRQQFSSYAQYGAATIDKLFTKEELADAVILSANYMESSYLENQGNGKFKMSRLPMVAQFAPVNGMIVDDVNKDGNLDVVLVGNDFGNEVFAGRYDALTGLVLLGDGNNKFEVMDTQKSGFYVPGDAKALVRTAGAKNDIVIASRNRNTLKVFQTKVDDTSTLFTPATLDAWAELLYDDGKKQRVEFQYGGGYLSQSTRKLRIPNRVKEIIVYDSQGKARKIDL